MDVPPPKKRRRVISLAEKLKMIQEYDKKEKNLSKVADLFNVPITTLSTILKARKELEGAVQSGKHASRKTLKGAKFEELEKKMYEFFSTCREAHLPLNGHLLLQKAEEIALRMNIDDFKASIGWLANFKRRHNIVSLKVCGEEEEVDMNILNDWHTINEKIIREYSPCDIFNFDEMALFYQALPEHTLAIKGMKCHGGKKSKVRVTVGLFVNKSGTEKIKPVFIGKHEKPRCFKNINKNNLPVFYECNNKSWMNRYIFERTIQRFNRKMSCENRKVLLITDNASCHRLDEDFSNVKFLFLPPNSTSKSQPLDKGIIQNVKTFYRKELLSHHLRWIEMGKTVGLPKWTLLHAIRALDTAWKSVTTETIVNCWRAAGFPPSITDSVNVQEVAETTASQRLGLASDFADYFNRLGARQSSSLEDYIALDDDTLTRSDGSTNEETPEPVPGCSHKIQSDSEEDENDEVIPPLKKEDLLQALNTLHHFSLLQEVDDDFKMNVKKLKK